jgi:hypothetical protein
MEFIDRNSFDVRAAVYTLKHPNDLLEFILLPMIHVGTPEYYRKIRGRLEQCDRILFEGVSGTTTRILTLAYRFMVRRERLGLVTQDELRIQELGAKLVHADVDPGSFQYAWAGIPLRVRAFLVGVVPFYALYLYLSATRESIAKGMEIGDLPTREEILDASDASEQVDDVVLHGRDAHLAALIADLHRKECKSPLKIAVLFGAAHMRAVARVLINTLSYRIVAGDWVTVFEL